MVIPLILHQIWIGPKKMPLDWMNSWKVQNPDMEYRLWREPKGYRYQDKIDQFIKEERYSIAADIMRAEILLREGGVYVDADSIALASIQHAPFMQSNFWACQDYTEWVANGTIGCTPDHPIMQDYVERMADMSEYWEFGARLLSACLTPDTLILPTCTFYPVNYNGKKAHLDGPVYAEHVWGTTKGRYA